MAASNQFTAASSAIAHQAFLLALPFPLPDGRPLVVGLLALPQPKLDLGDTPGVEVDAEWNKRVAAATDRTGQPLDLAAVKEQLARPFRLMIVAARLLPERDMAILEPDFPVPFPGEGPVDVGAPGAQRLCLAAGQNDAGLDPVLDGVVAECLAVAGDCRPTGMCLPAIPRVRRGLPPASWHP